jgi:hypothetical protein
MSLLDLTQWPAMLITVIAAWFVASTRRHRRRIGFWLYLVSNVLWVAWGLHSKAYALILLQLCLAAMNIRGERKASDPQTLQPADCESRPSPHN